MPEIRFDIPDDMASILDGFCQASGKSRKDIGLELFGAWAAQRRHEAIVICRVAGINPLVSATHRRASESRWNEADTQRNDPGNPWRTGHDA